MGILNEISEHLQAGDVNGVTDGIKKALDDGVTPKEILNTGLIGGMSIIGEKFKNNEVFVPEVLIAARAMNAGMDILKPKLIETGVDYIGKFVIGTVKGDLHDIGKNLVKMMFEGNGFEVIDLGTDVAPEQFVAAVKEHKPDIVGMSALLTTTMPEMENTIKALKDEGLRDDVAVMIGGAPVTDKFASEIGADAYAKDAATAATMAKKFLS
ncbi:corrinoid protein [Halothermothrix orenii]|uniref:Methionine synthase n=1 Tax=Halothermothrix orenii (strain H 168 / OCM 544 / DSM 9562) TaxID=373903 RepID=B8CYB6_HALOH|nr:corrinoid protein [Halothermothrix orenii]ACL70285.1 Methionine synthase [Halothermothrix orenii H 168]